MTTNTMIGHESDKTETRDRTGRVICSVVVIKDSGQPSAVEHLEPNGDTVRWAFIHGGVCSIFEA